MLSGVISGKETDVEKYSAHEAVHDVNTCRL